MVPSIFVSVAIVTALCQGVLSKRDGAPASVCGTMMPSHGVSAQTSASPYTITTDKTTISAGDDTGIQVTIQGTETTFEGLLVQARDFSGSSLDAVGTFELPQGETYLKTVDCTHIKGAVTHSNTDEQSSKTFTWKPPTSVTADVEIQFRATIAKVKAEFWTGVTSGKITVTKAVDPSTTQPTGEVETTTSGKDVTSGTRVIAYIIAFSLVLVVLFVR
ncbi:hypothetical protein ScPMuIL_018324 [Solemya velum]